MTWKLKFTCGCVFPRSDCIRKWINSGHHYVCPKHPNRGTMTYRIAICEVCLKEFKVQAKGQIPHQCPDCSTDKKKSINDFVTIIPLNHPDMKANQERSDCKHRINKCLKKYADQEYLPCRTCENYEPKKDEPVIFAYHGQNDWLD